MNIELLYGLQSQRNGVDTFLLFGGIDPHAVIQTRSSLKGKRGDEIDVILHSAGGSPADAYRLIRSFREHYKVVNVIIPFWAKSAATLFALGADHIVMQEYGELGPIDAQIKKDDEEKPREEWESALNVQASLLKIEELSNRNFVDLFTNLQRNSNVNIGRKQLAEMLLAYNSNLHAPLLQRVEVYEMGRMERYLSIGKMYARRIIRQYSVIGSSEMDKVEEFLDFITYECPDHGYVLDYSMLRNYLPNVIRSTEPPYGTEYDRLLDELSYLLMNDTGGICFTGFVNAIPKPNKEEVQYEVKNKPKAETTNIEEQVNDHNSSEQQSKSKNKRPSSKSSSDNDSQES